MTVPDAVVAGIDPHADTIHVAVITTTGRPVTDAEFPTNPDGYQRAITFLREAGEVERVGVEGAAGYGSGVSRALRTAGVEVVEVSRPSRADRRRAGPGSLTSSTPITPPAQCLPGGPARSRTRPSTGCARCTWPAVPESKPAPPP